MKNFKFLLILVSMLLIGFSFSACSDDDDEESGSSEIADSFWIEYNPKESNGVQFLYFSGSKVNWAEGNDSKDDYSKADLAKSIKEEGVKYKYNSETKKATWSYNYINEEGETKYEEYEFQITTDGKFGTMTCTYWYSENTTKDSWSAVLEKQ